MARWVEEQRVKAEREAYVAGARSYCHTSTYLHNAPQHAVERYPLPAAAPAPKKCADGKHVWRWLDEETIPNGTPCECGRTMRCDFSGLRPAPVVPARIEKLEVREWSLGTLAAKVNEIIDRLESPRKP